VPLNTIITERRAFSPSKALEDRSACSSPIRMAIVRAGLRWEAVCVSLEQRRRSQVWIADFDGAAGAVTGIHELTTIATEAAANSVAGWQVHSVTSDVYPECDGATKEEAACNANKVEAAGKSKVKALIFDRLLYRHWNAFKVASAAHFRRRGSAARHELPDSAAETQAPPRSPFPRSHAG